ncbi:MAG: glycosyltransferase family 2 protein [Candidatus Omnitrophota bacterium]|nr:glycosyltransferase family 2 protein [Candidatus Omnitrophota bacterium]
MKLSDITPVILTRNEAPNIARNLDKLRWAQDIVVVDSFSTDETCTAASAYNNIRLYEREFDNHANQWNFAISETNIRTEWILALDADYILADDFSEELQGLIPPSDVCGYEARFRYCVGGKPLRASLYAPVVVLYRKTSAHYVQDGHTQRLRISENIAMLTSYILHDDRKTTETWIRNQTAYAAREAEKLSATAWGKLDAMDRIRRMYILAPPVVFVGSLIVKGLILDGAYGLHYATQRALFETILSLQLLEAHLKKKSSNKKA